MVVVVVVVMCVCVCVFKGVRCLEAVAVLTVDRLQDDGRRRGRRFLLHRVRVGTVGARAARVEDTVRVDVVALVPETAVRKCSEGRRSWRCKFIRFMTKIAAL